ncbi:helix-turn-helix domain-containing protein [Cryptosporangium japonicum]|uniref:Helix-turn-helix domain-containing protein n=1 Tax=Cryptosporangium japonicum TaxID=80872 RepID=A0ABN0UXM9_9ACTN
MDVHALARACARTDAHTPWTSTWTNTHRHQPEGGTTTPETREQLLYTIPEAAAALRVSRTTIYELLDARTLESVHIGRARRIPAEALRAYVESLRTNA